MWSIVAVAAVYDVITRHVVDNQSQGLADSDSFYTRDGNRSTNMTEHFEQFEDTSIDNHIELLTVSGVQYKSCVIEQLKLIQPRTTVMYHCYFKFPLN